MVISSVVSDVCPFREVLSKKHCLATWMVRVCENHGERETTSKVINLSSLLDVWKDMNVAKSVEFRTLRLLLPGSRAKTLGRCLDNWRRQRV